jgi:hypothetical protein
LQRKTRIVLCVIAFGLSPSLPRRERKGGEGRGWKGRTEEEEKGEEKRERAQLCSFPFSLTHSYP